MLRQTTKAASPEQEQVVLVCDLHETYPSSGYVDMLQEICRKQGGCGTYGVYGIMFGTNWEAGATRTTDFSYLLISADARTHPSVRLEIICCPSCPLTRSDADDVD